MIGRRLGHYEIVEKLGEGGMGAVYRARDTTLGRDVALKLLPEFVAGDSAKIARLEREARLLASLSHPNVATLHGLEESNGLKYLVMELVPGETLAERISRGPVRIEECLGIFRQIAEGLEAAHEKGIVHRDLKPANVVVTSEGRVKVLDFGLAKAVAEEAPSSDLSKSPTLTREGTELGVILGTASYMSPEQARGKTLDRRTDIWSFGCVFYEALTGRKAFSGETVSDILAAILEREPDWSALPATTPSKVRDLLRWCLEKDRHRRLRDIGDARIEGYELSEFPGTARQLRYLPWVVAAALFGVALMSWLRPETHSKRAVSRLTVNVPPEQALDWENDPSVAISPDGSRLVFVGGHGSERKLYVRSFDEFEARPILGTEGATTAFFAPNGDWLGFYTEGGKVKKVRLDSGAPMTLAEVRDECGASWSPDDTIVVGDCSGLSRVPASGGPLSVMSKPNLTQGEILHAWPDVLPGGRMALFTILTGTGPRIGLLAFDTGEYRVLLEGGSFARYIPTGHMVFINEGVLKVVPFDLELLEVKGEPVPIIEGVWYNPTFATAHFAFSQDGTLVYVSRASNTSTLVWVDRSGAVEPIPLPARSFEDPRLSPDGTKLAVTIRDRGTHVWAYEFSRGALMRLTFSGSAEAPVWTADGEWLAFGAGSPRNLFYQRADGSGTAERLTTEGQYQVPTSWSPDGKALVYHQGNLEEGWSDIWVIYLDEERRARPLLESSFNEAGAVISPDGRFFAYHSNESGRREVYVRPFPGPGSKTLVSTEGGGQPVWARSGRELFYRNGDAMMAVPVESEPTFRPGRPKLLFQHPFAMLASRYAEYDVAPDGERFVMIQESDSSNNQIHVVLNWHQELKARVPPAKR